MTGTSKYRNASLQVLFEQRHRTRPCNFQRFLVCGDNLRPPCRTPTGNPAVAPKQFGKICKVFVQDASLGIESAAIVVYRFQEETSESQADSLTRCRNVAFKRCGLCPPFVRRNLFRRQTGQDRRKDYPVPVPQSSFVRARGSPG